MCAVAVQDLGGGTMAALCTCSACLARGQRGRAVGLWRALARGRAPRPEPGRPQPALCSTACVHERATVEACRAGRLFWQPPCVHGGGAGVGGAELQAVGGGGGKGTAVVVWRAACGAAAGHGLAVPASGQVHAVRVEGAAAACSCGRTCSARRLARSDWCPGLSRARKLGLLPTAAAAAAVGAQIGRAPSLGVLLGPGPPTVPWLGRGTPRQCSFRGVATVPTPGERALLGEQARGQLHSFVPRVCALCLRAQPCSGRCAATTPSSAPVAVNNGRAFVCWSSERGTATAVVCTCTGDGCVSPGCAGTAACAHPDGSDQGYIVLWAAFAPNSRLGRHVLWSHYTLRGLQPRGQGTLCTRSEECARLLHMTRLCQPVQEPPLPWLVGPAGAAAAQKSMQAATAAWACLQLRHSLGAEPGPPGSDFTCPKCGNDPPALVMDGITLGVQRSWPAAPEQSAPQPAAPFPHSAFSFVRGKGTGAWHNLLLRYSGVRRIGSRSFSQWLDPADVSVLRTFQHPCKRLVALQAMVVYLGGNVAPAALRPFVRDCASKGVFAPLVLGSRRLAVAAASLCAALGGSTEAVLSAQQHEALAALPSLQALLEHYAFGVLPKPVRDVLLSWASATSTAVSLVAEWVAADPLARSTLPPREAVSVGEDWARGAYFAHCMRFKREPPPRVREDAGSGHACRPLGEYAKGCNKQTHEHQDWTAGLFHYSCPCGICYGFQMLQRAESCATPFGGVWHRVAEPSRTVQVRNALQIALQIGSLAQRIRTLALQIRTRSANRLAGSANPHARFANPHSLCKSARWLCESARSLCKSALALQIGSLALRIRTLALQIRTRSANRPPRSATSVGSLPLLVHVLTYAPATTLAPGVRRGLLAEGLLVCAPTPRCARQHDVGRQVALRWVTLWEWAALRQGCGAHGVFSQFRRSISTCKARAVKHAGCRAAQRAPAAARQADTPHVA